MISKSTLRICLLIVAGLAGWSGLYGQHDFRPGYVVNKGDTIRGLVDYRLSKNSKQACLFKKDKNAEAREYSVYEVEAFGFNIRQFERIMLDEPFFARVLAKGSMSLYRLDEVFYLRTKSSDSLILLRPPVQRVVETGSVKEPDRKLHIDRPYIGTLNYLLVDCGIRADHAAYSPVDLARVVNRYNQCKHETVELKKGPVLTVRPYLVGGYTHSKVELDSLPSGVLKPIGFPTGGIGLEFAAPRSYDRIKAVVEMQYIENTFRGVYVYNINGAVIYTRRDEFMYNLSYLKLPVALKYNVRGTGSSVYFKVGGYFSKLLRPVKSTLERETTSQPFPPERVSRTGLNHFRNPRGLQFSIGYETIPRNRLGFFGEARFEKGAGFVGRLISPQSVMTNFVVVGGIRF